MKKNLLFIITVLAFQSFTAVAQPIISQKIIVDSSTDNTNDEEIIANDILDNNKIQFPNQVTNYGFKNLFSNSSNALPSYSTSSNAEAGNFIESYARLHSTYLNEMKNWGKPYFNLMESILEQYGLPKELKYIAVIESNLKTGAVSCKGAGGPWQFMPATARAMGLTINSYTDERTDYFKSTHAACKYLLQLYNQLDDWLLVMAGYNGGPGRVLSAIKRSGSRNFWDLQYYLPEESRTYVKKFIATHYIMEGNTGDNGEWTMQNGKLPAPDPSAVIKSLVSMRMPTGNSGYANPYDIKLNVSPEELEGVEAQTISGKYNSLIIAKTVGVGIQQFNRLNPSFDHMIRNNGNYDLRLPEDKMELFLANKYQILNECVQALLNNNSTNHSLSTYNKTFYKKYSKRKFK